MCLYRSPYADYYVIIIGFGGKLNNVHDNSLVIIIITTTTKKGKKNDSRYPVYVYVSIIDDTMIQLLTPVTEQYRWRYKQQCEHQLSIEMTLRHYTNIVRRHPHCIVY